MAGSSAVLDGRNGRTHHDIGFLGAYGTGEPITCFVIKLHASGRKKSRAKVGPAYK